MHGAMTDVAPSDVKRWLLRVTARGIAVGVGMVVASFGLGIWFSYRWGGLAGLHRALEFRPSDISFDLWFFPMEFAFGFAISPFYEFCKWADSAVRAWWTARRNSN
jgi:hypothetical protein